MTEDLQQAVDRLQEIAERLRDPSLDRDMALKFLEECADLATRAVEELDRQTRAGDIEEPLGQGDH